MSDDIARPSEQTRWQRIGAWLVRSHTGNPALARQGKLAAIVLLLGEAIALIALLAILAFSPAEGPESITLIHSGAMVLVILVLYLLNRRGLTSLAGLLLSLALLEIAAVLLFQSGPLSPKAVTLIIPVILAGLFGPPVSALVVAGMAGIIYLAFNLRVDPAYFAHIRQGSAALQTLLIYLNLLIAAVTAWLVARMTRQALEESQELSLALVEQRIELEERITIQTRQLQATTTVARAVVGTRDLDQLLEDMVRLVRESFGYYHVQVFLVDDDREYAVLQQSTGEVGQRLLARGHRLPVGSLSVIGRVTASGRPVIARDTDQDTYHRRNELLPNTRTEVAIPLQIGEQVIGALDMQSIEPNAFDEEMLPTFQALADQLAIAIENARLFEQAQENLREFRELSRDVTHHSWEEFLETAPDAEQRQVYGPEPKALQLHRSRVVERILGAGNLVFSSGEDGRLSFIAAPVVVRNEVIGVLGVEPDGLREWTQEDLQLLQSIAERTAMAVENARLYIQSKRAAEREHLISEISTRLQRAPSLSMLLESAAREIAQALGTDNVYAELSLEKPMARTRKQVSRTDEAPPAHQAESKAIEDNIPGQDESTPDQPEEARTEL